jgi:predicted small secreted protein
MEIYNQQSDCKWPDKSIWQEIKWSLVVWILGVFTGLIIIGLSGCGTVNGMAKDLQRAGKYVEQATEGYVPTDGNVITARKQ